MVGHRRPDGSALADAQPGDYWKLSVSAAPDFAARRGHGWLWCVCDPTGSLWSLGPSHWVEEHTDGTISVSPSLWDYESYHGHLTDGVWS